MRKSLSILLAVAMVFTMFAGVAFAADQPTDLDRLKTAKVIIGGDDGQTFDDAEWKREDLTVLLSRLYGAEAEAKATAKDHTFADVNNPHYDGYITWASKHDPVLMQGHSEVSFGHGEFVNAQQLATVLLRVLGIDHDWKDAVDAAVEAGIFSSKLANDAKVTRGASYGFIVNTLDSEVEPGVTLGASLNLPGWEAVVADVSVSVVAANQIKVSFSSAVDSAKTEFSVKWGALEQDFDANWADDKKSVVLESDGNYAPGKYTVEVDEQEFKFEIEAQKLVSFTIDTQILTAVASQTVKIAPIDQYGNVFVASGFTGTAQLVSANVDTTTFSFSTAPSDNKFTITGLDLNLDKVVVVSVAHTSGLTQTATFTVNPAAYVNSIVLGQPEVKKDTARIAIEQKDIVLPITLVSQYGNEIDIDENQFKNAAHADYQFRFISSNTTIVDPTLFTVADGKLLITTEGSNHGTVTLTAVPLKSPNSTSVTFVVNDAAKIDTLTLQQPSALAVVGEELTISYSATDSFGAAYTLKTADGTAPTGAITWIIPQGGIIPTPTIDGDGKIKVTPIKEGIVTLTTYVNGKAQNSITLDVKAKKVASKVDKANSDEIFTLSDNAGQNTYSKSSFDIKDQHNRVMNADDDLVEARVSLALKDPTNGIIELDALNSKIVKAIKVGSAVVIYNYVAEYEADNVTPKTTIKKEFTVKVIPDVEVVDYEKADISNTVLRSHATGNDIGTDWNKKIEIKHGLTEDGTAVGLSPTDKTDFTLVTSNNAHVEIDNATKVVYSSTTPKGDEKGTVSVWKKGVMIAEYDFVTSTAAPALTSFGFNDFDDIAVNDVITFAFATGKVKEAKDQYGVDFTGLPAGVWMTTNKAVAEIDSIAGTITGKSKGEATITYVTNANVKASFKIKVN